jgi:hypothetical protein
LEKNGTQTGVYKSLIELRDYVFELIYKSSQLIEGEFYTSSANQTIQACYNLRGIFEIYIDDVLQDEVTQTYNIASAGEHTIKYRVTNIYDEAFKNFSELTSVTIGNGVTSIGESAFANCSSLTSITIPNSVTSIGNQAFYGCPVEELEFNAAVDLTSNLFNNITQLNTLKIGDKVTSIGNNIFQGCTGLTSVTIGNSVTSIGESAFANCSSLTSITIPNSVTTIGDRAFTMCSELATLTIGQGVTSIGTGAFYRCALTSVTLNSNTVVNNPSYTETSNISDIFGDSVTEYIIGDSVTNIIQQAFYGCADLRTVTIGNGVADIDVEAFCNCTSLTTLTIGNGVTHIADGAFYNCTSLASVTVEATTPPTLGNGVFNNNASGRIIYVPSASVATYKAASGWSSYASAIQAIP